MKTILRHFIINTYCLFLVSKVASGMQFGSGITTLILAGIAITLVSVFAKPIINLLLLPLNLITFGLFRWVASAFVIYISSLIIPAFKIINFHYNGLHSRWIDIPTMNFHGLLAYVAFSFLLSLISSFIYWLIK